MLVAEDNDDDFFLLERCCNRIDPVPKLIRAKDGLEALSCLSTSPFTPSLILSDLKMPRLSGIELLFWVKQQEGLNGVPFLILTSSRHDKDFKAAQELGVDDYMVKPSRLSDLEVLARRIMVRWCINRQERSTLRLGVQENRRLVREATVGNSELRQLIDDCKRKLAAALELVRRP
jgi:CheY-like chemotaxis protein